MNDDKSRETVDGLVSVIVPVFNRADFLHLACESVLAQEYERLELILVDDGSTDDTPEKIAKIEASDRSRVRTIRVPNGGPGRAREVGRLLARGEFIQYLDSDDLLLPCKLRVQVAALQANPDCGVAYGPTRLIDQSGRVLQGSFKHSGERRDYLFPALLVDRWWNTITPLYRRSVCDLAGPWAPLSMAEDWIYDARIGALRTKLIFVEEEVAEYRTHSGPRLTGGSVLSDRTLEAFTVLIDELLRCATQANTDPCCAEMDHLSRWAFSLSRSLALRGKWKEAKDCHRVARSAGKRGSRSIDLWVYGTAAKLFGWKVSASVMEGMRRLTRRSRSPMSLNQSWMES